MNTAAKPAKKLFPARSPFQIAIINGATIIIHQGKKNCKIAQIINIKKNIIKFNFIF
ncbi:hypothetical protein D3C72_626460 [compost metagenome]